MNANSLQHSYLGRLPSEISVGHKGDGVEKRHKKSGLSRSKDSENSNSRTRKLHKDWRTWVVVVLMLTAMGIYVLTLDDSVEPTGANIEQGRVSTVPSKPQN